jgi:hypothetical protein
MFFYSYTNHTRKIRLLRGYVPCSEDVRVILAEIYYPKGYYS